MVSFGSAPLEQTQSREILEPELLPKPVLDAISQAVIVAMKKHAHGEKIKGKLDLLHVLPLPLILPTQHTRLREAKTHFNTTVVRVCNHLHF